MLFETLPIELIFEVFEYLHAVDIFRSFNDLNHQINEYLTLFPAYRVDFHQITKTEFTKFSQQHLPLIHLQIKSLISSDDDDTPNISSFLLKNHLYYDRFQYLQYLNLHAIESSLTLVKILDQCHQLTVLTLIQCKLNPEQNQILNRIWSLPKLHSCILDGVKLTQQPFSPLSIVSKSMRHLLIKTIICESQDVVTIFRCTPHLRQLQIAVFSHDDHDILSPTALPKLTTLQLSFTGSFLTLQRLFQQFPRLKSLRLKTSRLFVNGNEWKEFICDYVPLLKNFSLAMDIKLRRRETKPTSIDEFLSTFQTNFWLIDHQWFVRLDRRCWGDGLSAVLYTLPFAFEEFRSLDDFESKFTCDNIDVFRQYDHVKHLQNNIGSTGRVLDFIDGFPNVNYLETVLPCSESFLSIIPSLNQLRFIDVAILEDKLAYQQLQTILDRSPYLELLRVSELSDWDSSLLELKNASIRRLDLFNKDSMICDWYLSHEDCIALANSSIGQQCRTLVIELQERRSILELIERIPLLQSLTCRCKGDPPYPWSDKESMPDTLLEWLHQNLPRTSVCSRRIDQPSIIHIWIR